MTKLADQVTKRFAELVGQGTHIRLIDRGTGAEPRADPLDFYAWASSVMHILKGTFGNESPHYSQFTSQLEGITNNYIGKDRLSSCLGILKGAKSDVDGGYLFNVSRAVSGEVFGDFLLTAKAALGEGNHTVAAVLACAALEDALKRYALTEGLDVADKTMEEVVNAIKSKGLVSGTQKSLLATMPKIRNHAMHAQWDKITTQDSGSVVGFVEQFLLMHFP